MPKLLTVGNEEFGEAKTCSKCFITQNIKFFRYKNKRLNKLESRCSGCINQYRREWSQKNREKALSYNRAYRQKPEAKKLRNAYNRKWRSSEKGTRPEVKLKSAIMSRFRECVKNGWNSSKLKYLGCTIEEYKSYIETKFKNGMTWDNWSLHGWHIDHIMPLCNFDLTKEEELYKAFHYTNTQPLWALDNLKKSKFVKGLNNA